MDRNDLRDIARIRLKEARCLLKNGNYDGAYYLSGYVIECALKACIAKQTRRYEFPDRKTVNDSYTHNIENLFKVAELWEEFKKARESDNKLFVSWASVKDWSEKSRYEKNTTQMKAKDLYSAITNRQHGVLRWIKQHW